MFIEIIHSKFLRQSEIHSGQVAVIGVNSLSGSPGDLGKLLGLGRCLEY